MAYPSGLLLAAITLVPVLFAFVGWMSIADVLLAYWWAGVMLAIMAVVKLHFRPTPKSGEDPDDPFDWPLPTYLSVVGIFSLLDLGLIAVIGLRGDGVIHSATEVSGLSFEQLTGWVAHHLWHWPVVVYLLIAAAFHIFSFFTNYLQREEFQHTRQLLGHEIARIASPQVVVLLLAPVAISLGWAAWIVALAGGVADVLMHLLERLWLNPDQRTQPYNP